MLQGKAIDGNQRSRDRITGVAIGPYVRYPRAPTSRRAVLCLLIDDFSRLIVHAALIAAPADGKALVDDECAKKAVAELNRDRD